MVQRGALGASLRRFLCPLECLVHDLRQVLRGFRRQPGFTALAGHTLALGIGGARTTFSVIQNIRLDLSHGVDGAHVIMPQPDSGSWSGRSEVIWRHLSAYVSRST